MNINYFSDLTPQEKQYAIEILKQYSSSGKSDILDSIVAADFIERPVDIETFIRDPQYLGNAWLDSEGNLKLYPYWLDVLKDLFPDPYTTKVNNAIFTGARGLGKSEIAVTCVLYLIHRVLCMKNPLQYYGLKPTEKICFAFMNITKTLAEDIAISKYQKTVQLSPWFMKFGKVSQKDGAPYWHEPDPLNIIIGSQPSNVIGQPIFAAFFDEISFIRNQDIERQKQIATDMIDTALGGMQTRFIKNGKNPCLLILASSKRSEKSFLEEHMKTKLASEKENVKIVDEPVWIVKPSSTYSRKKFNVALGNKFLQSIVLDDSEDTQEYIDRGYQIIQVPVNFRAVFLDDIDRALCDYAGISANLLTKYISGIRVNDCVQADFKNPFSKEILEVGNGQDDKTEYKDFFDLDAVPAFLKSRPLFIHMDMSVSGDKTGICGVWIKGKKASNDDNNSKDLVYQVAFSVSIKAPKGRQISFEKNRNFIYWLREMGFIVKGISTDTFQSVDTGQALSQRGYDYTVISVDRVNSDKICLPYQSLRSAIYEKRLIMFQNNLLIQELTDLERNNNTGKIDHPDSGRTGSKDQSDALCGALFNASQHAAEFTFDYGEDLEIIQNASNGNFMYDNKQQFTIDFEEALKQSTTLNPLGSGQAPILNNKINNQFYVSQGILL